MPIFAMENAGEEEEDSVIVDGCTKPVRHRKKMFYRTLRHQMEFYFSDANLSKNRFMGKLLLEDPHVDLTLFLTFNKIRAMTDNVNDIVKALRKSRVLSVTEDSSKVFRTTEINKRHEEDKCTIYVEHLPSDAEHEWLRSIFLPYGDVPYISIPKYHLSKMNKGFAFVEFETPESADRALEAFGAMGCRLSAQTSPEDICSLGQGQEKSNQAEMDPDRDVFKRPDAKIDIFRDDSKDEVCEENTVVTDAEIEQKGKKRKIDDDEDMEGTDLGVKKAKREVSEVGDSVGEDLEDSNEKEQKENVVEVNANEAGKLDIEEEVQENEENENGEEDDEEGKKRKSRKHKKKKHKRSEHRVDPKHALRVLSKVEWQALRTKYVGLQKSKMKALKQQLARSRWVENYSHEPKEQQVRHGKDKRKSEPAEPVEKTLKEFTFVPDVIVRVGFKEPAVDVKAFKAAAKTHADVVYVDVSEGATEAFVRCGNADAANRLVKEQAWSDVSLLAGKTEKDYWEKITRDRDQKVKGNVANLVKRRGKDKLLKKAEKALGKHIRFEAASE